MVASAQGIDISAYQSGYTAGQFEQYSFAFVKASEGGWGKDANFEGNWKTLAGTHVHRGAYHELWPTSKASAASQYRHFADTVKAQGVRPGDMLAVVSSDYAGVTGAEVQTVLEALQDEFPLNPVLIYSDLARLSQMSACKAFPLWLADYQSTWPATPGWNCKFWQWSDSSGRLDRDAFNGTAQELTVWIDTFSHPAKRPATVVNGTVSGGSGHASGTVTDSPAVTPPPPVITDAEAAKDLKELEEFVAEHQ